MAQKELSESTIKEVRAFFSRRLEQASKAQIWRWRYTAGYEFFRACGFVFASDSGRVIHSRPDCGNGYHSPITLDLAYKKGYRKVCSKCGPGSYIDVLLEEDVYPEDNGAVFGY